MIEGKAKMEAENLEYAISVTPGLDKVMKWLRIPDNENPTPVKKSFDVSYYAAWEAAGSILPKRMEPGYIAPYERARLMIERAARNGKIDGRYLAAYAASEGHPLSAQAHLQLGQKMPKGLSAESVLALAHLIAGARAGYNGEDWKTAEPRDAADHVEAGLAYLAQAVVNEETQESETSRAA